MEVFIEQSGEQWEGVQVRRLSGREAISQLFSFDLEIVCEPDRVLPEDACPGADVTLVLVDGNGDELRRIHGMLGPIDDSLDPAGGASTYRLRVVPRVFRLTQVETQDVYLGLTVPQIIERKLEMHNLSAADYEFRLIKDYPVRELVVQYRESDLAFVFRLAEHLGISLFFDQSGDSDKIVFTDHPGGFQPIEGAEELTFRPRGEGTDVYALAATSNLTPTSYVVQDYNYRKPTLDLVAFVSVESGSGGGIAEYGSHVKSPAEAKELARVRSEERVAAQRVYRGKSSRWALTAGWRSTLVDHPRLGAPEPLLFVSVEHDATMPVFGQNDTPATYSNSFRAIPGNVMFRPPRVTPRPQIHGFVTGVIQPGPQGETGGFAQLDAEGRYTVQLHFDTAATGEQRASHPVRMAQPFVGPSQGMHFPLRPGAEVLLAFANGDPDRPVIIGAVPNALTPSPVDARSADRHRISTAAGALFEIRDGR